MGLFYNTFTNPHTGQNVILTLIGIIWHHTVCNIKW